MAWVNWLHGKAQLVVHRAMLGSPSYPGPGSARRSKLSLCSSSTICSSSSFSRNLFSLPPPAGLAPRPPSTDPCRPTSLRHSSCTLGALLHTYLQPPRCTLYVMHIRYAHTRHSTPHKRYAHSMSLLRYAHSIVCPLNDMHIACPYYDVHIVSPRDARPNGRATNWQATSASPNWQTTKAPPNDHGHSIDRPQTVTGRLARVRRDTDRVQITRGKLFKRDQVSEAAREGSGGGNPRRRITRERLREGDMAGEAT